MTGKPEFITLDIVLVDGSSYQHINFILLQVSYCMLNGFERILSGLRSRRPPFHSYFFFPAINDIGFAEEDFIAGTNGVVVEFGEVQQLSLQRDQFGTCINNRGT